MTFSPHNPSDPYELFEITFEEAQQIRAVNTTLCCHSPGAHEGGRRETATWRTYQWCNVLRHFERASIQSRLLRSCPLYSVDFAAAWYGLLKLKEMRGALMAVFALAGEFDPPTPTHPVAEWLRAHFPR